MQDFIQTSSFNQLCGPEQCKNGKDNSITRVCCKDGNRESASCLAHSWCSTKAWVASFFFFLPSEITRDLGKIDLDLQPSWVGVGVDCSHRP